MKWKIIILCAVCALCNEALGYLRGIMNVPLFLDTVFTVAICFAAGMLPGILTGLLLTPLVYFLIYYLFEAPYEAIWYFFHICILAEILLVCFFHARIKNREEVFLQKPSLNSFTGVAVQLIVLVALDCVLISVTGGTVDFILGKLSMPMPPSLEDTFELALLRNNIPVLASAIFSRIPINIVSRFIAVFGGYGVSLVFRKWLGNSTPVYKSPE